MTGAVSAYLFDGVGTLFDCRPTLAEYIAHTSPQFGSAVDPADAARALATVGGTYGWPDDTDDAVARKAGWLGFFGRVLAACATGHQCDGHADLIATFLLDARSYALYDDALPALRDLRADGHKLGLVSNFDRWLRVVLRHLGLAEYFEVVVISGEVGVAKPDPRIFREALDQLGVAANRTVFVGDSIRIDVDGGRAVGMTAVLLDREGAHEDHRGWRVRSLSELRRLLSTNPRVTGE